MYEKNIIYESIGYLDTRAIGNDEDQERVLQALAPGVCMVECPERQSYELIAPKYPSDERDRDSIV